MSTAKPFQIVCDETNGFEMIKVKIEIYFLNVDSKAAYNFCLKELFQTFN